MIKLVFSMELVPTWTFSNLVIMAWGRHTYPEQLTKMTQSYKCMHSLCSSHLLATENLSALIAVWACWETQSDIIFSPA